MPHNPRSISAAERGVYGIVLLWLIWLPLPFGSNVDLARTPLIVTPLALLIVVGLLRWLALRNREQGPAITRAWKIFSAGGALFIAFVALQLVPLPGGLLRAISPESFEIWSAADRVATLAGVPVASMHPITIDPAATRFELFRLAALFAAFQVAAILIRTQSRRVVLAIALTFSAIFQISYGVHEAALGRYAIWGWVNRLIFSRVTGTFVNPNHFAHYVAIIVPLTLFLAASIWRDATPKHAPLKVRIVRLFERGVVPFGIALVIAIGCVAAVLLAQSRGGLLALAGGMFVTAALLPGRRLARIAFAAAAGAIIVAALVFLLGQDRTRRMGAQQDVESSLGGRRIAAVMAARLWSRFSIAGSGAGTFDRIHALVQTENLERTYHRAHNDYLEIGATTGTIGFVIAIVTLTAAYVALVRQTLSESARDLRWKRRAYQIAALTSLTIAMVHALVDFNFFIPANPSTLAVILGAAVASVDHDRRTRR